MKEPDVVGEIRRFVLESEFNRRGEAGDFWFDEPMVGFASARDPIFREYKTIIGDFHLTPLEIFEKESAGAVTEGTVIAGFFPSLCRPGKPIAWNGVGPPWNGQGPELTERSSTTD